MIELCLEVIANNRKSKYGDVQSHLCQRIKGHMGNHDAFFYLRDLTVLHPLVVNKIIRDATKTTGAAWKSEDAGPNRISRWIMLLPDDELLKLGINMQAYKPQVIAKLREKAATYAECMEVAKKLTWLVYQMIDAPKPTLEVEEYLQAFFGPVVSGSTTCIVCRETLSFVLFSKAARGKAEIETGHRNPRAHNANNVGFAHRECNIAQGSRTLAEFYTWIVEILKRVPYEELQP
jgi:hypothetical protein